MKPPVSVRRTIPFCIISKPAVHHEVLRFLRLSPLLSRRRRVSLSTSPQLIGLNECGIRQQRSRTSCGLLPDLRGGTELEVMVFQYSSAPDEATHSRGDDTMIALSLIRGSAPIALRSYSVGRLSSCGRCRSSGEKLWSAEVPLMPPRPTQTTTDQTAEEYSFATMPSRSTHGTGVVLGCRRNGNS